MVKSWISPLASCCVPQDAGTENGKPSPCPAKPFTFPPEQSRAAPIRHLRELRDAAAEFAKHALIEDGAAAKVVRSPSVEILFRVLPTLAAERPSAVQCPTLGPPPRATGTALARPLSVGLPPARSTGGSCPVAHESVYGRHGVAN